LYRLTLKFGTMLGKNGYSPPAQIVRGAAYLLGGIHRAPPSLGGSALGIQRPVRSRRFWIHCGRGSCPKQGRANIHLTQAQNLSKYWDERSVAAISA